MGFFGESFFGESEIFVKQETPLKGVDRIDIVRKSVSRVFPSDGVKLSHIDLGFSSTLDTQTRT